MAARSRSEYGSRKLLRTVVAAVVSAMFLTCLALARPYRRSDDLCLACVANLLLTRRGQQWHLFLSHVWSTGQVCRPLVPGFAPAEKGT